MNDSSRELIFVISSLGGGGAEQVCVTLANALADRGWAVRIIVFQIEDAVLRHKLSDNLVLDVLEVSSARYAVFRLTRRIMALKPRKVLAFNYEVTILLLLIRNVLRKKFKIVTRNVNNFSMNIAALKGPWQAGIVAPLIRRMYDDVDHVINQCEGMKKDLVTVFPALEDKTSVIYNPVSHEIYEASLASKFKRAESDQYFLCIGRLEHQKRFEDAIEAFYLISHDYPGIRLKIVGTGSLEGFLKERACGYGIGDRVDFEGFQQNVVQYYRGATGVLLTSRYEGFPNVLIEAITMGVPVVSYDCPSGPSEIIVNGVNGYLIENGNIAQASAALREVLTAKMPADEIIRTSKKYNLDNIIVQYERVLDDV